MTNAEKYLEGVNIDELTFCFDDWHFKNSDIKGYGEALFRFLQAPAKPTLTEDERVILRNIIGKYTTLYRNDYGYLILQENSAKEIGKCHISFNEYNHLFQFIKNGEEYSIEELLGDEK